MVPWVAIAVAAVVMSLFINGMVMSIRKGRRGVLNPDAVTPEYIGWSLAWAPAFYIPMVVAYYLLTY